MDFMLGLLLKISFIVIAIGGALATQKLFKMKEDNFVEEVVENVIKDELGVNIDMTPDSPEPEESEMVKDLSYFVSDKIKKLDK